MRDWYQELLSAYHQGEDERLNVLLKDAQIAPPQDPGYFIALAEILTEYGNIQEVMEAYALALRYDAPATPDLVEKIQHVLARYQASHPDPSIPQTRMTPSPLPPHHMRDQPIWQRKAHAAAMSGRGEDAYALLENHVVHYPNDPDSYIFMAKHLASSTKWDDAFLALATALSLQPFHIEALFIRGILLQEQQRYREALGSYLEVVLLDSTKRGAWNGLAKMILYCGYPPRGAIFAYQQAQKLAIEQIGRFRTKPKIFRTR